MAGLAANISWKEVECTPAACAFIEGLLTPEPTLRLGGSAVGSMDVRSTTWLALLASFGPSSLIWPLLPHLAGALGQVA